MAGTVTPMFSDGPKSIQAEQQAANQLALMSESDVDAYVREAADETLVCRAGGHRFPLREKGGFRFVGVTPEGFLLRHLTCQQCGLVRRVERWDVRHKGDKVTRMEFVSAAMDYSLRDHQGQGYLAKSGRGRMSRKQVRGAVATMDMAQLDLGFTDLVRSAKANVKAEGACASA